MSAKRRAKRVREPSVWVVECREGSFGWESLHRGIVGHTDRTSAVEHKKDFDANYNYAHQKLRISEYRRVPAKRKRR